nr:hypothetical protein [Tanacetum cinerariifolium]
SLLNQDSSIISSSKIDSLLDEFAGGLILLKSIPPGIDEADFTPSEPVDSLSIGDEHLNTIPATESDEFIKSCVKNFVPNPSESEGENECDVPAGFTTFSNVLFDADYDFDSDDDQSFFDEDFPKKIYSNPLFDEEINPMKIDQHPFNAESDLTESMPNHDSSITISSKIDSLFAEFADELTLLKSIPPGIDETDCHPEKETRFVKRLLYDNSSPRLPEEIVYDNSDADIESFSPSHIPNKDSDSHMEEIDLPFILDDPMPPGIEDDDYESRRDIPILEKLIDNYSLSLPTKVGRIDDDILLTIKDDVLREKLLNVNLLIAKIEALNANPTPSSDCKTKSSSTSLNSLLEETNTFDNSLPEFEAFFFDVEDISSGSTTTPSDISLSEYEAFYDDHVKEISSASPTTHSDSPLYASFIFDLSIKPVPPADRSDFYEFTNELSPFISPPEYDCFLFKVEPNSRDFTKDVVEDIYPMKEP